MAYNTTEPSKQIYVMAEDEAKRLMERHSHMDVFKKVQDAKVDFGNKIMKLTQGMYLQPVGKIPHYGELPFATKFDSEDVEKYLEDTILYQNATQLLEKREEYAVIEDDFGPTLEKLLKNGKTPSFQNLMDACSKYDKEKDIKKHRAKSQETYAYFTDRGVSDDDARAYAFAIAFYTGAYSWAMSMEANVFARRLVKVEPTHSEVAKVDDNAAMIMYYLIKGLSQIDFYWGVVKRYITLTDKDLNDYKPGEIVTWLQFSSSEKSGNTIAWFNDRNTVFTIFSLTGRAIRYFSNCADQEDEVLFLPHSSFLVCNVEYGSQQTKHQIYLRQIELGLCKYVVLWVDDHIFEQHWENKKHMEKASTLGTRANVHFIPKSNTESALTFLRSEFGQRLKQNDTFRIVTDMKRTNEDSYSDAGARLIREVRKLGFNHMCLIFTGNEDAARAKINNLFANRQPNGIRITQYQSELEKFVLFERC